MLFSVIVRGLRFLRFRLILLDQRHAGWEFREYPVSLGRVLRGIGRSQPNQLKVLFKIPLSVSRLRRPWGRPLCGNRTPSFAASTAGGIRVREFTRRALGPRSFLARAGTVRCRCPVIQPP